MTQDSPAPPASGTDVFISYASQDAVIANGMVAALEEGDVPPACE